MRKDLNAWKSDKTSFTKIINFSNRLNDFLAIFAHTKNVPSINHALQRIYHEFMHIFKAFRCYLINSYKFIEKTCTLEIHFSFTESALPVKAVNFTFKGE